MRDVLVVLFDEVQSLDVTGPVEVFAHAGYRIRTASLGGAVVRTTSGLRITPDEDLSLAEPRDLCTGSLILAGAGLLDGRRATSHWLALDELKRLGASPASERVVFDGKYVTAAGVSAGIDMGLTLAGQVAGDTIAQSIQLGIEYDPQPPYDAGSPAKAPEAIVAQLRANSRFILS